MTKPVKTAPRWVGPDCLISEGLPMIVAKAKLYQAGFKFVGAGACAATFSHPDTPDRAVKLVCGDTGHRRAVDMFVEYPDIVAFPQIYGLADLDGGCFAYETELLEWRDDTRPWRSLVSDRAQLVVDEVAWDEDGFIVDLHEYNVMQRPDGEVVIVDPFHAGDSERSSKRDLMVGKYGYDLSGDEIFQNCRSPEQVGVVVCHAA